MFSTRLRLALGVFFLFSVSTGMAWAQMQSHMADADSAAIKQSVAAFSDAWNRHDSHAVAMRYVEDGDFSSTQGIPSHGSKELEEHYVSIFGTFLKNAHRTDTVRSIRFLTPSIAQVDIDWQMTGAKTPDGADAPPRKGLLNWVMTKQNGEWSPPRLLPNVFHHRFPDNFRPVNVAAGIRANAFGRTGIRMVGIWFRVRNKCRHRAVFGAPDANAPLKTWVPCAIRFVIGHVNDVILADKNPAGLAELLPLIEKFSILIEDLDPVVSAVGNEQTSFGIESQGVGRLELPGSLSLLPPRFDELPISRKLHDPRVRIAAMPIADEDVAIRGNGHGGRPIKSVWSIAGDSRLTERHQDLSIRVELEDLLALSIFSLGVSCPHVPIPIYQDAVRDHEHPRAEALHQLPGMIEFEDGRFRPALAGVSSASLSHPHVAVTIQTQLGRLPPRPSLGHLRPAIDREIRIGQGIGIGLGVRHPSGHREHRNDNSDERKSMSNCM